METIRFKGDSATRRRFFTPESFAHPAKMACGLVGEIAARYGIRAGDWVLDPMAGSGTTMLLALQGINVCLVELESHFVTPMRASWDKMQQHPMLGCELGQVTILQGDARKLPIEWGYPLEEPAVEGPDAIITSPPFQDQEAWQDKEWNLHGKGPVRLTQPSATSYTRPVDAVISSPPYEGIDITMPLDGATQGNATHKAGLRRHYTRPVDAVVTSPPYEGTELSGGETDVWADKYRQDHNQGYAPGSQMNIGNLRNAAYWEAMSTVYRECHRVLKSQGVMALVLKGFTRDGKYIDLPQQTADLCESLGFTLFDRWKRELWNLSFWRTLQKKNSPESWDERLRYETVLAFHKKNIP